MTACPPCMKSWQGNFRQSCIKPPTRHWKSSALSGRTDLLETKHDELVLAHADLCKDYESLAENFQFLRFQVEDPDNRNRRNNLRLRGIPEAVTDLIAAANKLFHTLLPSAPATAFVCDRIHRALSPNPPADKPQWDVIICLKGRYFTCHHQHCSHRIGWSENSNLPRHLAGHIGQ